MVEVEEEVVVVVDVTDSPSSKRRYGRVQMGHNTQPSGMGVGEVEVEVDVVVVVVVVELDGEEGGECELRQNKHPTGLVTMNRERA